MELGVYGRLPKVFSREDLQWLRTYLKENGETYNNNPDRAHLTNFHNSWEPVNDLLSTRLCPVVGNDMTFRIALANIKHKHDDAIHTDICFRYSSMPKGITAPIEDDNQIFYTFLIVEDYEHEYGNYKPSTYLFERSHPHYNEIPPSYDKDSIIDESWPKYEVTEKTKSELAQYPTELLERFKILAVLDKDPLTVNYWRSVQFHTQDAYNNHGVKWKKYFAILASKKI